MDSALARTVADLVGPGESVVAARPVGGGCISIAWWVELSRSGPLFVKVGPPGAGDLFEREAEGLAALASVGELRVPTGARAGSVGERRFLVMEAIASGSPAPDFFADFGRRVAELHRADVGDHHGFSADNYIGGTSQPNTWMASWTDFFRERRLGHQLALARERGLANAELSRLADRLLERLDDWLGAVDEPPSLLHGDLWSGNFMVDGDGAPVLIDPACYHGHRETDLAMTRLFGGFSQDFYAAYEEAWPVAAGSAEREEIYKLYHLLNHLNLFGGAYHGQCVGVLKGLA